MTDRERLIAETIRQHEGCLDPNRNCICGAKPVTWNEAYDHLASEIVAALAEGECHPKSRQVAVIDDGGMMSQIFKAASNWNRLAAMMDDVAEWEKLAKSVKSVDPLWSPKGVKAFEEIRRIGAKIGEANGK